VAALDVKLKGTMTKLETPHCSAGVERCWKMDMLHRFFYISNLK